MRKSLVIILLILPTLVMQNIAMAEPDIHALKSLYKRDTNIPYPDNNQYTKAKEELGKKLFFDPRLSDTDSISCATCHNPAFSWVDGLPITKGKELDPIGGRKSMALLNLAWDHKMLWDGRADNLEDQVKEALEASKGMSNEIPVLLEKIKSIPGYRKLFKDAFVNEPEIYSKNDYINLKSIQAAIATFERGIVSETAPFDRWVEGKEDAISASAQRGFLLFNDKAKCAECHTGWRFSDGEYYNIGVKEVEGRLDRGLAMTAPLERDLYFRFKTVGLRNIDQRPPYMHNGSVKTLEEVIEFYNKGGEQRTFNTKTVPLNLTQAEKNDLLEFLKTLTSEDPKIIIPRLPH